MVTLKVPSTKINPETRVLIAKQVWDEVGGGAIHFGVFPYISDTKDCVSTQQQSCNSIYISQKCDGFNIYIETIVISDKMHHLYDKHMYYMFYAPPSIHTIVV